jgi:cobalt-zinc-cadmium efflux system membrane fusion protein
MNGLSRIVLLALLATVAACSKKTSEIVAAESAEKPAASGPNQAAITSQAAQNAGIEVAVAGPTRLREMLTLYGSIAPNAEREQEIRARYPGVVRSVAKRAGDSVAKGEELLTIESNESLQVYPLRAPLSGQVLERRTNVGDAVDGSAVLMKVADLSSVWLELSLFARDLGQVRAGMKVLFRGADADESGEATITYVSPAGHADSQSVVARAIVENRDGRWVPGQFVTADNVVSDVQVPVAVNSIALQELQQKTVVFVQNGQGFEARPVNVGRRAREAVEITEGLNANERYVAKNSYLIKADLLKGDADED